MYVYATTLAMIYLSSLIAAAPSRRNWCVPPRLLPVLLALTLLTLVCGLRYETGTDTANYISWYVNHLPNEKISDAKDFGFSQLCKIIYLLSDDPQVMLLIVAFITTLLMILTIRSYGRPFELAMFLYVVSGVYFFAFNGIRQALATAVVFAGSRYIFERDWKKFVLVVLLAATLHSSALVFVPLYFIANRKEFSSYHFVLTGITLLFFLLYGDLIAQLFKLAENVRYVEYATTVRDTSKSASIYHLLVQLAILTAALMRRKQLEFKHPQTSRILINYAFVTLLLTLISMKHLIYARLAFYPSVFNILLVSYLPGSFGKQSSGLVYTIIVFCFLIYSYLLIQSGQSDLIPYKSVLHF